MFALLAKNIDFQLPGYKIEIPADILPKAPGTTDGVYEDLGSVVGVILPYVFYIAIFITLIMLIFGGFQWMTSGGDSKATQAARGRITSALIGLVLIFVAYWLMRTLEVIFHISRF